MDVRHGSARPVAGGAAEIEHQGAQIEGERVGLIGGGHLDVAFTASET
jgi:hypothetical protein